MTRIVSLLLFIVLPIGIFATDFDEVLSKIGSYDYGDSRENLTTISEMLREASGDVLKLTEYEKAMLEVLAAKETTFAAKQFLCKELSIMGTEQSVPTLAKLLQKDETADIARYALERIPGDKVDAILLVAMGKTKGKVRVGVINTIGERQIKTAAPDLGKLMTNKEADVAMAAATALGKIATDESATLLGASLLKLEGKVRDVAMDAYLKNADAFLKAGDKAKAEAIYEPLFAETESIPTRSAALTGLIKTVDNPTELIVKILQKDENPTVKAVAISLVHQCKRDLDLPAIAATMPKLDALGQIQLLTAFRMKGDPVARDIVVKAVDSDNEEISTAAIQALAVIGDKSDAERLARLAASSTGDKKELVKEALARLNAEGTNDAIIAAIPNAEAKTKVELVESIGERQMTASIPTLLDAAQDENVRVRVAALKALSQVSSPSDINALIDLLINAQSDAERRESERMVVAVATKIDDKDKQGDAVLEAITKVDDIKAKSSLMLVAGSIGDPDALPVLRQALASEDNELKRAAILSLSEWPTPEPLKDLKEVAGAATEPSHKVLALRGYIRLIGLESDRAKPETVALYKTALDLATDAGEKRMALSGLGKVRCPGAMFLAAEYLDDPELKGEAEIAVLENSWSAGNADRDKVKAVLQKVYENTDDERLKRGAKQMLDQFNQ
ncbi:HEAT repeat domain-containing protein [candidate division KSB1 bacterium]|nr:HEAT repeat domain-containing protein [candidate division KSB1 bacterium]RQW00138.1 MAG: HEAT repeat domain-containing protein [candidate division KSB1 bacterium]